jgi:hypothetical protein
MFRCYSYTTIRERINLCLLKLQLLKQSIKIRRCVVNMAVVWLHILGHYWCLHVALFRISVTYRHQQMQKRIVLKTLLLLVLPNSATYRHQ